MMTAQFTTADLLASYGPVQEYTSPRGNELIVFPTCPVPSEQLFEENWHPLDRKIDHGNCRRVRHIAKLADGSKTNLYVKSPEVLFTASFSVLEKGRYWWGGRRSGEKYVAIVDQPLVQEQSEWEALILLGLHAARIPAEIPYALSFTPQGGTELIVGEVREGSHSLSYYPLRTYTELSSAIDDAGFSKDDFGSHNLLRPQDGLTTIIDVNRWRWSPYTDFFDQQLLALVRERAELASRK